MYENHVLTLLRNGTNSVGYYSLETPNSLIVFVHGFAGKSVKTWNDFPLIIKNYDEFRFSDIIFYGYPSLKRQANDHALEFYNDLHTFITESGKNTGLPRDANFVRYEKIILVGHSLGALVIRKALWFAQREPHEWVNDCKMILFAPAHLGAYLPGLAMVSLPGTFKVLAAVAHFIYPVLNDLRVNSEMIQKLQADTQELLVESKGEFTKAFRVVWTTKDHIVHNDVFGQDPNPLRESDKTHITVCKPVLSKYIKPVELLIEALQ